MKQVFQFFTVAAITAVCATSCKNGADGEKQVTDSVKPLAPVAIAAVTASPEYKDATIAIKGVKAEKVGADSAKVSFEFEVKNYELKAQTSDKDSKLCANSDKGQHIHFILDNAPYKALYDAKNEITLANGTEHYLLAFLSRSYHESIKSEGSAVVYHFEVDKKGNLKKLEIPKTPLLFYSRPKGDYYGADTANLLLDYYIWNYAADSGIKVKAEIANTTRTTQTLTTTLDKWESKFIQNLGTGKSKVTLTLLGKDGNPMQGPLTSASREFNLAVADPMKK
jgi:hypothetical protein